MRKTKAENNKSQQHIQQQNKKTNKNPHNKQVREKKKKKRNLHFTLWDSNFNAVVFYLHVHSADPTPPHRPIRIPYVILRAV